MKSYVKSRGWLFPVQGGPHANTEVRLPWPPKGVAASDVPLPVSFAFQDGAVYSLDHVPDKKPAVGDSYYRYMYDPCQTALEMELRHGWRAPNYITRIRKAIKQGQKRPRPPCFGGNHACTAFREGALVGT